jgi:1-phosphofructokinase
LVVSLNPAIDCEWRLPSVVPEEKNELASEVRWPGGKGINVARWLKWFAVPGRIFLPLGGGTGRELAAGLRAEGLRFVRFPLSQPNRVNVVVTPDHGPQFRFNQTWPRLNSGEARRLVERAGELVARADPVVISGTLAFGAPANSYARLVAAAARANRRVFLDCDREPFALAVGEHPFLVKPNEFELGQWAGRSLKRPAEVLAAARRLSRTTGGWVLVSLGERGALLVNAVQGVALEAATPPIKVRNTVGAGDALLAGVVAAAQGFDDPGVMLRWAVATGSAAAELSPGKLPSRRRWRELVAAVEPRPVTA